MEIVLKSTKSEYLEIFSSIDLDNIHETFKKFSSIKEPLEANIFAINESISSHQLSKSNKEKTSKYLLLVFFKTISIELNLGIVFY